MSKKTTAELEQENRRLRSINLKLGKELQRLQKAYEDEKKKADKFFEIGVQISRTHLADIENHFKRYDKDSSEDEDI